MTKRSRYLLPKFLVVACLGVSLCGLGACAKTPDKLGDSLGGQPESPALDENQLGVMLTKIDETLSAADTALDDAQMVKRVVGPALKVRTVSYALGRMTQGAAKPPHLPISDWQVLAMSTNPTWPRNVIVVSQPSAQPDAAPDAAKTVYMFGYEQGSVEAPYALWGWVRLFPGIQVPQTFKPDHGSTQPGMENKDLAMEPSMVAVNYAKLLNNISDESVNTLFNTDVHLERYNNEKIQYAQDLRNDGTVTFDAQPGKDGFLTLGTTDGGAIVMTTLDYSVTYQRTRAGATMAVGGALAPFLGGDVQVRGTVTSNGLLLAAFYIPPKDADNPRVTALGAERSVISAARDDSVSP
ncbi:MAG: hypothetical protein Q4G30_05200 [Actinomycetaceae bacterium]|nr:hypothetical protein [Actinomycetaceae bacterium]